MPLLDTPPHYRAFLLRFWAEHGQAPDSFTWRFTLEDPHSGERQGFRDLEALVAWLRTEMRDEQEAALARALP
jgi:hypothetical protein